MVLEYLNINPAKSLQKNRKQFASRQKQSPLLKPRSCLIINVILTNTTIPHPRSAAGNIYFKYNSRGSAECITALEDNQFVLK